MASQSGPRTKRPRRLPTFFDRLADPDRWRLLHCHPTTSAKCDESDITLRDATTGRQARIEITDIVSATSDSNAKEKGLLRALKVLAPGDPLSTVAMWPEDADLFVGASAEFGRYLLTKGRFALRSEIVTYRRTHDGASGSVLIAVLPGPRWSPACLVGRPG